MDVAVVAFVIAMGLVLIGGLYTYGALGISSAKINRFFGNAMLAGIAVNILLRLFHVDPPQLLMVAPRFMVATGFMGLITDGVIFKIWKPRPPLPTLPQHRSSHKFPQ